MKAIIKNELRKYFYSPLGYIIVGAFIIIFSLYVLSGIASYRILDLGIAFYCTIDLAFPVLIALLTMGIFAEERKSGTEKILLTAPISTTKMILAKLIAATIVVVIATLLTSVFYFIFNGYGAYGLGEAITQQVGFILVAIAGISFGMFASSLCDNPVIAGAIVFVPALLMTIFSGVGIGSSLFDIIRISSLYINFAKGIISVADILILCLFTTLFFTLTLLGFKRRRLVK